MRNTPKRQFPRIPLVETIFQNWRKRPFRNSPISMGKLLEGLKRFKKEMALVATELSVDVTEAEAVKQALELYGKFTQEAMRVSTLINAGTVTEEDRAGIRRLEEQLDSAWQKLSEEARKKLVDMLLIKKMLPEEIGVALRVFDAKVVNLV